MKHWQWLATVCWLIAACKTDTVRTYDIADDIASQRNTLLALYNQTAGSSWTAIGSLELSRLNISTSQPGINASLVPSNLTNSSITANSAQLEQQIKLLQLLVTYPWNTRNVSYCQWQGITCCLTSASTFLQFCSAGVNSVTGIFLPGANLNGTLPEGLFSGLPDLQQLNVESNPNLSGIVPMAPEASADKLQFFSVVGSSLAQCSLNQTNVFAFNASCYPSFIQADPSFMIPAQLGMQCPAIAFNRSGSTNNILLQVLSRIDPAAYQQLLQLINSSSISTPSQQPPPGGQGPPGGGFGDPPGGCSCYPGFAPLAITTDNDTAGTIQCMASASSQTASQSKSLPIWQVAVPAVIGGFFLLAALFATVKLAPGIMDDLALLRMLKLKSSSPAGLMKPATARSLGLTPGEITLVITDLQGSTELWEWNSQVMDIANALHAQLARRLLKKYCGYEVLTEGDSFTLAFHDCLDAVGFTHHFQEALLGLDWPPELLTQPAAAVVTMERPVQRILFRGLRVRAGIHTGTPDQIVHHPAGGHLQYAGTIVAEANALTNLGHGGQILMSLQSRQSFSARMSSSLGIQMMKHMRRGLQADAMPTITTAEMSMLPQLSGMISIAASFSAISTTMLVQPGDEGHRTRTMSDGGTALAYAAAAQNGKKSSNWKRPSIYFPNPSHKQLVSPTFLDAPCAHLATIGALQPGFSPLNRSSPRVTLCFCKPDGLK
ncbi:hypothetical protein WJX84_009102, partial [Apatococcus fuscideae]